MTEPRIRTLRRRARYCSLGACTLVTGTVAVLVMMQATAGAAGSPVSLGSASTFGVLAGTTVTNTGLTVINGDLGLSPGTSVTGFPPGSFTGTEYIADTNAAQAQTDLTTAYNNAAGQTPTTTGLASIGNQTLTPGVYNASSSLGVGGTLTLDAQGDANAVFIFQAGSTLITASGTRVVLANGAQACNVFWQVGSSATLGTSTSFAGSILALTSITVTTGTTVNGGVLARNGAVTLDDDTITAPTCVTSVGTPMASLRGLAVAAGFSGLAGLGWFLIRRRRTAVPA
jgi:hypothetical protein